MRPRLVVKVPAKEVANATASIVATLNDGGDGARPKGKKKKVAGRKKKTLLEHALSMQKLTQQARWLDAKTKNPYLTIVTSKKEIVDENTKFSDGKIYVYCKQHNKMYKAQPGKLGCALSHHKSDHSAGKAAPSNQPICFSQASMLAAGALMWKQSCEATERARILLEQGAAAVAAAATPTDTTAEAQGSKEYYIQEARAYMRMVVAAEPATAYSALGQ